MCTRVALHFDKDQVGHWMYLQPHATVWLTSWMLNADGTPPSGHMHIYLFIFFIITGPHVNHTLCDDTE